MSPLKKCACLAVWAALATGGTVTVAGDEQPEVAQWRKQLDAWRADLGHPTRWTDDAKAVMKKIAAVDDPAAVKPVLAMIGREKDHNVKILYVQALGNIGTNKSVTSDAPEAKEIVATLAKLAVEENAARETDPVRDEAAKQLARLPYRRDALTIFIRYLGSKHVSRAAEVLLTADLVQPIASYDKPDPKLAPALINALMQKQKVPVQVWAYREGIGSGRSGLGRWGAFGIETGTKEVDVPNESVAKVLKKYTTMDYGTNQSAWRAWYEKRKYMP